MQLKLIWGEGVACHGHKDFGAEHKPGIVHSVAFRTFEHSDAPADGVAANESSTYHLTRKQEPFLFLPFPSDQLPR